MQEAAQILMDCVADIVDCHGLGPLRSMCEAMQLQRVPSAGTCLGEVLLDIHAVCCCPKNPSTPHMFCCACVTVPHAVSSSTISRHDLFCWSMQRLQPRQLPLLAAKIALSSSSSSSSCRCSTASQAPCQTASAEVQTLRP